MQDLTSVIKNPFRSSPDHDAQSLYKAQQFIKANEVREVNKTVPLWAGLVRTSIRRGNLIEWNTEAYDIRSARGLSEGNGLWPFIIRELKI